MDALIFPEDVTFTWNVIVQGKEESAHAHK